jgi:predicted SPOUT superfamily RNA methylase MTH1
MKEKLRVTKEDENGRNTNFQDIKTRENMTRPQLVKKIENGDYSGYHIRIINGIKTPCSNPDKSEKNNLG